MRSIKVCAPLNFVQRLLIQSPIQYDNRNVERYEKSAYVQRLMFRYFILWTSMLIALVGILFNIRLASLLFFVQDITTKWHSCLFSGQSTQFFNFCYWGLKNFHGESFISKKLSEELGTGCGNCACCFIS